jgi:ABC-type nickel/cobalt efflux system permease component RcnA
MRRSRLVTLLSAALLGACLALPAAAPAAAANSSNTDTTAIVFIALVGGLLVLGVALWAFARWWAWEPRWLVRARHATAEAGWRTSAAWAEFRDWVRLGR